MIKAEIELTEKENNSLQIIANQVGKLKTDLIRDAIERLISDFNRDIKLKNQQTPNLTEGGNTFSCRWEGKFRNIFPHNQNRYNELRSNYFKDRYKL